MFRKIVPACVLSVLLCPNVHSAEWRVYKFAEFGVTTTDNFNDSNEGELGASIKPSMELSFVGNRFEGDITAEVEFYRYNDLDLQISDPRLLAYTSGTLIDNLLYLDSSLTIAKTLEGDTFEISDDAESITRLRINPFLSYSFGRVADLYVGVGHSSTDRETDGEVDFRQDSLAFSFRRNPRLGGFIWGLGGHYAKEHYDIKDYETASLYGSVGATVGQTLYFDLLGGQEFTDFEEEINDALDIDDESLLWEASMRWTPTERTSLKLGWGERYYGEGPIFSLKHKVRNSDLKAVYSSGVTTSDISLGSVSVFDPDTSSQIVGTDEFTDGIAVDSEPFKEKRLQVGYKVSGRRSDVVMDAAYSTREQVTGEDNSQKLLGRIAFDRHLSPLTTFRIQYNRLMEKNSVEDPAASGTSIENRIGFKFIYNFDRKGRAVGISDEG